MLAPKRPTSIDDVFINCPFDPEYQNLFEALLFLLSLRVAFVRDLQRR